MCDPLSIAGLVATVAGSAISSRAANKDMKSRNRRIEAEYARSSAAQQNIRRMALEEEPKRREALRQEARAGYDGAAAAFDPNAQAAARDAAAAEREESFGQVLSAGGDYMPADSNAPAVVKTDVARRMTEALDAGREQAKRLARLNSFGTVQFGNQVGLARSGAGVQQAQDFGAGNAEALRYGMNAENVTIGAQRERAASRRPSLSAPGRFLVRQSLKRRERRSCRRHRHSIVRRSAASASPASGRRGCGNSPSWRRFLHVTPARAASA